MASRQCVCGHAENFHYAVSGRCMKIITRHRSGDVECTCRQFREEPVPAPRETVQGET